MAGKSKRARVAASQSPAVRTRSKKRSERILGDEEDVVTPQKVLKTFPKDPQPEVSESEEELDGGSEGDASQDDDRASQDGKEDGMIDVGDKETADAEENEANEADEGGQVKFAELVGVGEHSDDSDDEGPIKTLSLSRLPGQVVSEIRNDEPALEKKLADIAIFARPGHQENSALPFWESLSVTMPLEEKLLDSLALDDLKREERFAELATAATHIGLDKLRKQKTKFRRPTDYFAQMVKTDVQMGKVKAKILHHKEKIESAEKRRNNRDIAKNKKKVRSSQLQREQEKKRKAKEEIEAFSRLRKQRVKERAEGSGQAGEEDDDAFPIELLDVEQLDDQNVFQSHADVASGKKKAWSRDSDKFSNGGKAGHGKERDSKEGERAVTGGKKGKGKLGASGRVQKGKGSKKRVGRSRRKAAGK